MKEFSFVMIFLFIFMLSNMIVSTAVDTIAASQVLRDGETIVSTGGRFELGFFSPGSSTKRYLGIWYHKIASGTVVWVANRETPINNTFGALMIEEPGILVLRDHTNHKIWSSNSSRRIQTPIAQLLDSGNLIVRDGNDSEGQNFPWQSFDFPCDTFLPGMKLGRNSTSGLDRYISSWKSTDDPSRGDFVYRMDPNGFPQVLLFKGSIVQYRTGPWNGLRFSGTPELKANRFFKFWFVFNQEEMYYTYELLNTSVISKVVLSQNGIIQRFMWIDQTQGWQIYLSVQLDNCDTYASCGPYGSCNIDDSPVCACLKGFVPKFPNDWEKAVSSHGCVRKIPLGCGKSDGFIKYSGIKLPDTRYSWFNVSMNLKECNMKCLKNCSCTAYANLDIRGRGSGCLLWFDDLIDIRQLAENGQDLYMRMAASELGQDGFTMKKWVGVIFGTVVTFLILGLCLICCVWRKKRLQRMQISLGTTQLNERSNPTCQSHNVDLELPLFDFTTIVDATNNFSNYNKIGEGGFGPVYKGFLKDGQEIAVKRLSKDSRQGLDEFKNEVILIAKLQHRNLVKLLGCCIHEEEKLLIYEYMPNRSLDSFIFDDTHSKLLDWPTRFNIINGIARGLLYLHQDSRLRIIHRDLKPSNVLLDQEMNPKISDFGLARSFDGNETAVNTSRLVGTYGYMSPEFAIDGLFSVKSDTFSYGVLVLEIVSGKRNRGFRDPDHYLNLLGHAWILFKEGKSSELIASSMSLCKLSEVLRSIHVGLLCVQQCPEDRPSMSSVVLMLGSEAALLPTPKMPGFFAERQPTGLSSSSKEVLFTPNSSSLTLLEAR